MPRARSCLAKPWDVVTHTVASLPAQPCKNAADDGRRLIPSSCAMSVWIEYTSGTPAPAHSNAKGTFEKRSVMITARTTFLSLLFLSLVVPSICVSSRSFLTSRSSCRVNRDQIFHTNPGPGASVSVPGKFARWYRGIFVFGSWLSTVQSSTAYPPRSSSRAYSRQRAATPPAPLMSVTEGTRSMTTPGSGSFSGKRLAAASAHAPARSDAIELGVVGGEVADPTRRRDTGEDGTSQDPEDVVEGTATSRRLGDMTGPERLRRIDGTYETRVPNVAGSARAHLPLGRPRVSSRVPRGIREVRTAISPPVPRGVTPRRLRPRRVSYSE